MVEGVGNNISLIAVFTEGLLSFLSPCVLPLIPLYISYLSSGSQMTDAEGKTAVKRGKVFLTTVFFVLGISFVFFLFAFSFGFLRDFLEHHKEVISIVGGVILIVFSLQQLGFMQWHWLGGEFRLPFKVKERMSYGQAFFFGFVFSFAWTPCIGPILSGVLLLAASNSALAGQYLLAYTLGFGIPFLLLGLFTKSFLSFLQGKKNILKYTTKIAAIILLLFGGKMIVDGSQQIQRLKTNTDVVAKDSFRDVSFADPFGNLHSLKENEGEIVYLNFIATWCHYCKQGIPYFEDFVSENQVKAYYVMSHTMNNSMGVEGDLAAFVKEYGLKSPLLIDEKDVLFSRFGIRGVPTLFALGPNGQVIGYVSGMMGKEQLDFTHKRVVEMIEKEKSAS